jgi:hypothetical protein
MKAYQFILVFLGVKKLAKLLRFILLVSLVYPLEPPLQAALVGKDLQLHHRRCGQGWQEEAQLRRVSPDEMKLLNVFTSSSLKKNNINQYILSSFL